MGFRAWLIALAFVVPLATGASAMKITVTQYGRIIASLPWAVALEKGMFKDAGLDIDGITPGSGGGTSLRNMLAGDLPYAEVSTSVIIAASRQGMALKAIDSGSNHIGELAWAVKPDSGITSIKDLVGKKVAFTNPRSTTEQVILTALKREGLSGKVETLPLGGLGPALTALSQDAVAAAPLNDPAMTLTPNKYKILFYGYQYYPKLTWQAGVTTKAFAEQHPDILRKILAVHRRAVEFVYTHPEETMQIYAKTWNVSVDEAKGILPKYYTWEHWSRGEFSKEGLDAVVDGLQLVGELNGPFDWSTIIDQSFLDEDLRRPL
jgi:NitT/TauT family transport system substrate-binding protein